MSSAGMQGQCYASCPASTVSIQPPPFILTIPGPALYCPNQPFQIQQNNPCAGGGGYAMGGSDGAAEGLMSLDAEYLSGDDAGDSLDNEDSLELFLNRPPWRPGYPGGGRPPWRPPGGGRPPWRPPGGGRPPWRPPGWGRPPWRPPGWGRPPWRPGYPGGRPPWRPGYPSRPPWGGSGGGRPGWGTTTELADSVSHNFFD